MTTGRIQLDRNNVFHGRIDRTDEYFTYFAVAGGAGVPGPGVAGGAAAEASPGEARPRAVIRAPGQNTAAEAAVIPMDDIIVSRERLESSAQNHFAGRVTAITPFDRGQRVDVDCDGIVLSALITPWAIEQLALEIGSAVHLAFKASAVRLY
jgi:molybdopterin-binding protein